MVVDKIVVIVHLLTYSIFFGIPYPASSIFTPQNMVL